MQNPDFDRTKSLLKLSKGSQEEDKVLCHYCGRTNDIRCIGKCVEDSEY